VAVSIRPGSSPQRAWIAKRQAMHVSVRPRRRWLRYVLGIALVIGCLAGLAAWRYWPRREKHTVALPPPAAAPGKVVVA
jgi:hypothetical protein